MESKRPNNTNRYLQERLESVIDSEFGEESATFSVMNSIAEKGKGILNTMDTKTQQQLTKQDIIEKLKIECNICTEKIDPSDSASCPGCDVMYHRQCIQSWICRNPN